VTGEFFDEPTVESLVDRLQRFDASRYSSEKIREQGLKFDCAVFDREITAFIEKAYEAFKLRGRTESQAQIGRTNGA
jgi:hypothetical protein